MSTPVSGSSAYADNDDMIARVDVTLLGDLLSDSKTKLSTSQVQSSTVLTTLLKEASGMVESAAIVGNRYSPADLASLTGNSLEMLKGIVCGVALFLVWERRAARLRDQPMPGRAEIAMGLLDRLSMGTRIFGIQEVADAHNPPAPYFMTPADVHRRASISDQARKYFGNRDQYNVPGQ